MLAAQSTASAPTLQNLVAGKIATWVHPLERARKPVGDERRRARALLKQLARAGDVVPLLHAHWSTSGAYECSRCRAYVPVHGAVFLWTTTGADAAMPSQFCVECRYVRLFSPLVEAMFDYRVLVLVPGRPLGVRLGALRERGDRARRLLRWLARGLPGRRKRSGRLLR